MAASGLFINLMKLFIKLFLLKLKLIHMSLSVTLRFQQ